MTYIGIALCAATPFLLLFAEPVLNRIWHREEAGRLAWIDDRIRTRPDQRHAWRQLKKLMEDEN